jgi:hypothetical protein
MRRARWLVFGTALVVVLTSCGGGKKVGTAATSAPSAAAGGATTTSGPNAKCSTTLLTGTEIGVTPKTITVTVVADTGSTIRPGLFQGSVDGVKAWAKYRNANGGLACRQVVVKSADSKLSPDDAKNSITAACGNSFALVGTTALFLNDMTAAQQCKDKRGAASGLPDLAALQTNHQEQCSPVSFAVLPTGGSCPYSGSGPRTFPVATTAFDYYFKKYGANTLHGVWVIPADLPSTIAASMPGFRASQQLGLKLDAEFGGSGLSQQPAYTPFVQAIKQHKSTYARSGLDYKGTVFLRKEAAVQGVNTVKVWDCSVQCYDKRLIGEGGNAVEGQYVWSNVLPFEDKGHNATLDNLLQYDPNADGFGATSFVAGELFAQAVNNIVTNDGPNGLTRKALITALNGIHDFTAGGFLPKTDIGGRRGSVCLVGMQVQGGKFVRIDPTTPGQFDCSGKAYMITLDPQNAFKG